VVSPPLHSSRWAARAAALWLAGVLVAGSAVASAAPGGKAHRASSASLAIGAAGDAQGRIWVVGLDESGRLCLRHSADTGASWSAPQCPDIGTDTVSVSGDSRPKIAFSPDGREAAIAYTRPLARPYTGEVRMLRSRDGGRSWSQPFTVHADRQQIAHRFEAIVFDSAGNLHVWWIDKRDVEGTREPGASVYRSVARAGGTAFGPDTRVARRSCECCRIALVADDGGGVAALWRHVFDGSQRDHAFARASATLDEPARPVRATFDRWRIEACPHHGPGLARAADGAWHAVWFGERGGQAAVRYGRLDAAGQPLGEARSLPDPQAEHADVGATGSRVVIAWRSFDGRRTRLRAWVSADDGVTFALRELGSSEGAGDQPRVLVIGARLMVVWRTEAEVRIARIED
jgi:hypothetical protein